MHAIVYVGRNWMRRTATLLTGDRTVLDQIALDKSYDLFDYVDIEEPLPERDGLYVVSTTSESEDGWDRLEWRPLTGDQLASFTMGQEIHFA